MKKLANLNDVKVLNKKKQKSINGGRVSCRYQSDCHSGDCCSYGVCYRFGTPGHICTIGINPW